MCICEWMCHMYRIHWHSFKSMSNFFCSSVHLSVVCVYGAASLLICMCCIAAILTLLEFIRTWFIWSPHSFLSSDTVIAQFLCAAYWSHTDDDFDYLVWLYRHVVTFVSSRYMYVCVCEFHVSPHLSRSFSCSRTSTYIYMWACVSMMGLHL